MTGRKLIVFCLGLLAGMGSWGDKLIYQHDFSVPIKKDRFREVVEVKDLPGTARALKLRSYLNGGRKVEYRGWATPVPFAGYSSYQLDYDFKPMDRGSRYALFVSSQGAKPVSLVLRGDQLWTIGGANQWKPLGTIPLGRWNRMRYVIRPLVRLYDVYVNDMQKPLARDLEFRGDLCAPLHGVWLEPSETEPATTYVANIRVTGLGEAGSVPSGLADHPLWLTVSRRVAPGACQDGWLPADCWKTARSVSLVSSRGVIAEPAEIRFLHDDQHLHCLFKATAKNQASRKPTMSGQDVKAYMDDSLELFLDPGHSQKDYFHLVTNAGTGRYEAACHVGAALRDRSWNPDWKVRVTEEANGWTAEVAIPFAALGRKAPVTGELWGVLAGRVNPVTREVGSWRPAPGFHRPDMFGHLLFADDAYLQQPAEAVSRELTDRCLGGTSLLAELSQLVKTCEGKNAVRTAPYREQFTSLQQSWTQSVDYAKLAGLYRQMVALKGQLERHLEDLERLERFFGPGSEASQRGFAYCVDHSMTRTPLGKYTGTDSKQASLTLAGRESGSFQLFFIAPTDKPLPEMEVSMTWQGGKAAPAVQFYQVVEIGTAMSRKPTVLWPDALIPRTKMSWRTKAPAGVIWVDLQVPAGMAAGRYAGQVKVAYGGQALTVPVEVTVLPFDLPLKNSLPTAFCFSEYWVREYYGKTPSPADRKRYIQFLLDHRLEPMNLWIGRGKMQDLSLDELEWAEKRGKTCLFLPITRLRGNEDYYKQLVKHFAGRLKPYFFGHDEVLSVAYTGPGSPLERMKRDYEYAKNVLPQVRRLNTARIDKRLFGYVNAWCPLFGSYSHGDATARKALGEEVWWYPTDYPLKPFAVFNLDNPGMDSRLVPWMNWALDIDGLLYWGLNREWLTQVMEPPRFTPMELKERGLDKDITPATVAKLKAGVRWPELRWIPFFRAVHNAKAAPSATNGGGNLVYPGPNFQPWPSTRLKNLRDGMQDYEYYALLKRLTAQLKASGGHDALVAECQAALVVSKEVVESPTSYTTVPERLLQEKAKVSAQIVKALKALK